MNAYDRDDNIVHMSYKYINMDRVCNSNHLWNARIFFDVNVELMSTDYSLQEIHDV